MAARREQEEAARQIAASGAEAEAQRGAVAREQEAMRVLREARAEGSGLGLGLGLGLGSGSGSSCGKTLSTMDCSVRSVRTRSRGFVPRLESHVGQTWLSRKWRMMHARQKVCKHSMMVPG